jgi:hypothetical protein
MSLAHRPFHVLKYAPKDDNKCTTTHHHLVGFVGVKEEASFSKTCAKNDDEQHKLCFLSSF